MCSNPAKAMVTTCETSAVVLQEDPVPAASAAAPPLVPQPEAAAVAATAVAAAAPESPAANVAPPQTRASEASAALPAQLEQAVQTGTPSATETTGRTELPELQGAASIDIAGGGAPVAGSGGSGTIAELRRRSAAAVSGAAELHEAAPAAWVTEPALMAAQEPHWQSSPAAATLPPQLQGLPTSRLGEAAAHASHMLSAVRQ